MGMPDEQIAELRPTLSDANLDALDAWNAMAGWFPERLALITAILGLPHLDGLFERLMTIREILSETTDG